MELTCRVVRGSTIGESARWVTHRAKNEGGGHTRSPERACRWGRGWPRWNADLVGDDLKYAWNKNEEVAQASPEQAFRWRPQVVSSADAPYMKTHVGSLSEQKLRGKGAHDHLNKRSYGGRGWRRWRGDFVVRNFKHVWNKNEEVAQASPERAFRWSSHVVSSAEAL